jgi:nucleoid-associated protein YgaU
MADTNFDPDPKRVRSLTIGLKRFLGGRIKKGGKGVSEKDEKEKGGSDSWSAEQWHEVKKGDTLWKIAEHYYGDGSLYMKIFEANRNILKDPNLIKVGQKLRIP